MVAGVAGERDCSERLGASGPAEENAENGRAFRARFKGYTEKQIKKEAVVSNH